MTSQTCPFKKAGLLAGKDRGTEDMKRLEYCDEDCMLSRHYDKDNWACVLASNKGGDKYDLNDLAKDIHATAKEKGWHEEGDSSDRIPTLLALVHSEVSEALEAYRCWGKKDISDFIPNTEERYNGKPGGFPSELADVTIRVLDICALYDIDIQAAIGLKMAYNKTRPYRHGGKRC